jgi:hypothetical protein
MLKKLCALLLALTFVLGMGTAAMAAATTGDKVSDILLPIDQYAENYIDVTPGDSVVFPLYADMFVWENGAEPGKVPVTSTQIRGVTVDSRNLNTKIMKAPTIAQRTVDGVKTMCVVVEFVNPWVSVDTVEFECLLFLRLNRTRKTESEFDFSGTFGHEVISIDSSYDYYAMDEVTVIQPDEYIKEIELDLGGGVTMETKLYGNRKYFGYAVDEITNEDDAMVTKYNDIVSIIRLYTAGLTKTGKSLRISGYEDCYVYNKSGKYLGDTSQLLEYADVLYISENKIDMGGGAVTSSTSASSDDEPPESENAASGGTTTANNTVITTESLTSLTQTAVSTAKASGSKTASVRVKSAKSVSIEALKAMASTASASGLSAQLNADIMRGTSVSGRITINPANATGSGDIQLGVYVDGDSVSAIQSKFEKWYQNDVRVVSLAQTGGYGMTVYISAKLDLTGMDTTTLNYYSYNPTTNKFKTLSGSNAKVDKNGYLQFQTDSGDMIIISEGALVRK